VKYVSAQLRGKRIILKEKVAVNRYYLKEVKTLKSA